MTNAELVEIKRRCDTALEGPWFSNGNVITAALGRRVAMNVDLNSVQFITHARTDVPNLLEEIAHAQEVKLTHDRLLWCAASLNRQAPGICAVRTNSIVRA